MLKLQQAWLRYEAWRNISPWSHNAASSCANQNESQTDIPWYNSKRDPSRLVLQLTASPGTTEASTRERWQFGALTNRKATSSNRDPSLTSLYY